MSLTNLINTEKRIKFCDYKMFDRIYKKYFNNKQINQLTIGGVYKTLTIDTGFVYTSTRRNGFKGLSLIKEVKQGLKKKVSDGFPIPKISDTRIKTVFYNEENCIKHNGCKVIAVDINNCYWSMLLKLGYISHELYLKGLSGGKDWKKSRVASVGSLGKKTMITDYININGKLLSKSNIVTCELNPFRLHLINTVFNDCLEIAKAVGSEFLFFLTDCFFVTENGAELVKQLLKLKGFEFKIKCFDKYSFIKHENKSTIKWSYFDNPEDLRLSTMNFNSKNEINNLI